MGHVETVRKCKKEQMYTQRVDRGMQLRTAMLFITALGRLSNRTCVEICLNRQHCQLGNLLERSFEIRLCISLFSLGLKKVEWSIAY